MTSCSAAVGANTMIRSPAWSFVSRWACRISPFRTIAPMGAETDALLHYSAAVERLTATIRELGLKDAIQKFKTEGA